MTDTEKKLAEREQEIIERHRRERDRDAVFFVLALPVMLLAFWVVPSYFEAQTYSRLTGKQVSTWDALWVDLRIQEQTK